MEHLAALFFVFFFVHPWDHVLGDSLCKAGEFTCGSGVCISMRFLCNGVDDCGDRTDEAPHQLCDGRVDCKGGRDEAQYLCGPPTSKCAASEFQCGDGHCIRHTWRCDNTMDCSDGSDEENCDLNECLVNNGGCPHVCVDEPQGFHCECPNNTKLVGDSHCEEINQCLEADVCDQLCLYTNGHLTCSCQEAYLMSSTTGECRAKGNPAQLFFTDCKGVQTTNISGFKYKEWESHLQGRGYMAALSFNHTLYWAQQGHSSIYRLSVDGKPQDAELFLTSASSVSGLAVDWIHQLMYWPSVDAGSINVGLLDGSAQHQLLTGLDKPCAMTVDPLQGLVFWAECGNYPKIKSSSLDGLIRKTLVATLIHQPVALSLDMPRLLLYWVDQGLRSISRVTLEGHHRKTVVESNGYLDRPFGLVVFEGFVYWSDEGTHSICRANKHDGSQFQVLLKNITSPGGVFIFHPALQPNTTCGQNEMVCQYDCALRLMSKTFNISCARSENRQNGSEGFPVISRTVPASASSDSTFAGLLAVTIFLSFLLMGLVIWWCREEGRLPKGFTVQSFSLKESRDPLILDASVDPTKETRLKLDLDRD